MKKCGKCGEIKDKSEFHKRAVAKDGLIGKCKDCIKILKPKYHKNYLKNKTRKFIDYDKLDISEKTCSMCKKTKDVREFSRNSLITKLNYGLRLYCKTCDKKIAKKRKEKSKNFTWYIELGKIVTEKKCFTCKKIKEFNEFSPYLARKYNKAGECKSCRNKKSKKRYKKDPKPFLKRTKVYSDRTKDKRLNSDNYMKYRLCRFDKSLTKDDITPELVELKRKHLKLKREVLTIKNQNQ